MKLTLAQFKSFEICGRRVNPLDGKKEDRRRSSDYQRLTAPTGMPAGRLEEQNEEQNEATDI